MSFETDKEKRILEVLNGLLRLDDIYACMLAKKYIHIVPDTRKFRKEILYVWEILRNTMNEFFDVISRYSEAGLSEVYFTLRDYEVMFFILPGSDVALVAIVPILANRGLLEVEMENARREIIKILELEEMR
ncbi:MAG TPA: hypothetical protein ENG50_00265 [Candidatus Altiarchaeales archaeon]|nr:hypothetical protein [Candidatus Altiarchaeales archaeon]